MKTNFQKTSNVLLTSLFFLLASQSGEAQNAGFVGTDYRIGLGSSTSAKFEMSTDAGPIFTIKNPNIFENGTFTLAKRTPIEIHNADFTNSISYEKKFRFVDKLSGSDYLNLSIDEILLKGPKLSSWGDLNFRADNDNTGDDGFFFRDNTDAIVFGIGQDGNATVKNNLAVNGTLNSTVINGTTVNATTVKVTGDNLITGKVGVGTLTPTEKFEVAGTAKATSFVTATTRFPDYVFENNYALNSLEKVDAFVKENKHLPGMPSEKEVVEKGMNLGQVSVITVEKLEELYLHVIQLNEKIKSLTAEIKELKK